MLKLAQKGAIPKLWKRRRQGPTLQKGASQQLIEKCRGARRGRNGPGPVGPGWLTWPVLSPVHNTLWPRCSSINCLYLRRPLHPSIHQRATDTKEKHQKEADGRRKSSSHLGDGLGHALAAIVGPTWWSHGGVPEPMPWFYQGNCTLYIQWWYKSCLFLILSYFDACLIHMCS
jgi:hypothetical protein